MAAAALASGLWRRPAFAGALALAGLLSAPVTVHAQAPQNSGGFQQAPRSTAPAATAPRPRQPRAQAPAPQPNAGRISEMAGRYAILREMTKDTGCMLTLDDRNRGPRGSFRALLAPACRDNGIVIFDPVGWQIDRNNRLVLTARKGHNALFERTEDGSWQKDPKEGGRPLGFRKVM